MSEIGGGEVPADIAEKRRRAKAALNTTLTTAPILSSEDKDTLRRIDRDGNFREEEQMDESQLAAKAKELLKRGKDIKARRREAAESLSQRLGVQRDSRVPGTEGFSWYDKDDDSMWVVQKNAEIRQLARGDIHDFGSRGQHVFKKWQGREKGWSSPSPVEIDKYQSGDIDDLTVAAASPTPAASPSLRPGPAVTPRTPDPVAAPAPVISATPVITGVMPVGITSAQMDELNRQIRAQNDAMAAEIASLRERLERHAAGLAELDTHRRIHSVRDADASRVLQIAHEKFAAHVIPRDATPEQRERIERSNALSAKTLRTLEKRGYVIAEMGQTIKTDAGRQAKLDALARHMERPRWQRFGTEALFAGVGALAGFGAVKALSMLGSYAGLAVLASLGAPFAGAAAAAGASFTFLWRKLTRENDIGRGRRMWHKSPFTAAALAGLASGVTTAFGPAVVPLAGRAKGFFGMIIKHLFPI